MIILSEMSSLMPDVLLDPLAVFTGLFKMFSQSYHGNAVLPCGATRHGQT